MIVHDLEERIMNVGGTGDDLDVGLHWIDDGDNKIFQTPEQDDCLMNMIIGIQSLHEQRSKMLFEEFEKVLKSNGEEEKALEEEIERLKKTVARERQSGGGRYTEPYEIGSIEGESRDPSYGEELLPDRKAV